MPSDLSEAARVNVIQPAGMTLDEMAFGALQPSEIWWREHYTWLLDQGYQLRERYKPDWTPSWKGRGGGQAIKSEDGQPLKISVILDAIRVKDGAVVALKKIHSLRSRTEIKISLFLNSAELRLDAKNHTVPVYDVLQTSSEPQHDLLVIPVLRHLHETPFATVGEIVGCVAQLLEGLNFLHGHNVAHRDFHLGNILMDATPMYPEGLHFNRGQYRQMNRYWTAEAHPLSRTECTIPVKYYFIDFGLAVHFKDDNVVTLATPVRGEDKSPPEFKGDSGMSQECDPFPTDVYYLGNALRQLFLDGLPPVMYGYRGLEFLRPFISAMMHADPSKRPTMPQVVARFESTVATLSQFKLRTPVSLKDEFAIHAFFRSFGRWKRSYGYWRNGLAAVPTAGSSTDRE